MERAERHKTTALARIPGRVAALQAAQADPERYVARALHWGATRAEIAAAVDTTRQSAHQRYRRLRHDPPPAQPGTNHHYRSDLHPAQIRRTAKSPNDRPTMR